jgi:hypothetical protein
VRNRKNVSSWRAAAQPIIARVLAETRGLPEGEIRAALRKAYPFGQRQYHPYKIWLDEIAAQRGTKKRKAHDRRGRVVKIDPDQGSLF